VAADPRWKLVERDGAMVAYQRFSRGKEFHGSLTGFQRGPNEIWMVALRFSEFTSGDWASSKQVTVVSATQNSLSVPTFYLPADPWKNWSATSMTVQGPDLFFDIFEARKGNGRKRTADALSLTLSYIAGVTVEYGRAQKEGYHAWYMPRREPGKDGDRSVNVSTMGRGTLDVSARVNPGREGWTWVRLLDDQLNPWEEAATAVGTREQVGWSDKPEHSFLLQGSFPVPGGSKFSGTAEVWFQPAAGGEPERLLAAPVQVPKR